MKPLLIVLLCLTALPFAFNACSGCSSGDTSQSPFSFMGTGTGNPNSCAASMRSSSDSMSFATGSSVTERLVISACGALMKCNSGLTYSMCVDGVTKANGVDQKLGIISNRYPTFLDLIVGESNGLFKVSQTATDQCAVKVAQLSCNSSEMVAAYQPTSADPFASLSSLFDPVCQSVLSEKKTSLTTIGMTARSYR